MALYELHERPLLEDPVLVLCLDGWIDAGVGAATALAGLLSAIDTREIATFDTDALLDHRARRPVVRIEDGVNTGLAWPVLQLRAGTDTGGSDVLLLVGPEPDHSWQAFCREVVTLAGGFGVRLVVGLGAFPAPVPHTRPVRLTSTATSAELASKVGFLPGALEVPAGVQAALERSFADAGIPAIGLWARVPHYVAAMPYPEASAALLDGLASLAGLRLDTADLQTAGTETRRRIDDLVANNPEHVQLVRSLEAQLDSEPDPAGPGMGMTNIPSGDEIAAELERFLRDQN